ncbi:ribonucleoside-triphosphate reductase class III catalytic subunit [Halanaerobium saccharolyticum]|uniref:Ribonucleoside-triphosphate reductase class III catalytic subunit n=1 Tax=Halanaerobium saccharolyticum TaxID=43595 RepID=A0A4R6RF12_9FIRM|nr:ribonucleoside triphosphate reductase [Halanaerobium saccharolyticum]TDP84869.1 ribonucleoside-triphosphate reductase class III catalytic subunit [Halanaerobium saccharolyticum]
MNLDYVKKRDGKKVEFKSEKIVNAVGKAAAAVDQADPKIAAEITAEVLSYLKIFFKNGGTVEVEQIQDLVEKVLIEKGYAEIAKAYILYREQHSKLRDSKKLFADAVNIMDDYLDRSDWKVNENSNMSYSLQGLNNYIASEVTGQYWLQEIYPKETAELHSSGDLHIHDLGNLSVYCCGWDLEELLRSGFRGVPTKIESAPPKHLKTALGQIVNFMYTLQGEASGAMAFSNFDTYLAPFIAYDGLNYEEVKQAMQEFLFNMNVPTRVGFQSPFTNITMDLEVPSYLEDQAVIIGGQYQEKCYGEFQEEMDMLNRAFAELMMEGDAKGRMFSFPIPTYNITEDFEWENEKLDPVWEMTAKFGIPYFSNFINSDMDPEDARSMCCRLRLDNKELRKRGGGLFGANPLTGSIGVVTLNMPRIGYQAQDKEEFMQRVYYLMDQAKESLEVKRKVLETLTEQGLYPYAKFYLRDIKKRFNQYWKNHFNTIGLNGMNEALLNFMGKDISTPEGQQFSEEVMKKMRERLQQYQEETENLYNLEATPAESTAYRFARLDREKFGDRIIAANQERVVKEDADPYYTNSTQLPVGLTDDIFTALELQDELQSLYTGGCIEKGNKVLTNKGAIKIEEIVRDYENLKPIKALSYNAKEDRSEWDLITDAMSIDVSKNNKIRVIAEKGLDITTSDWHPFFVLEKISVKDKCPVCGEKVKGTKSFSTHTRYNPECRKKYKTMFKFKVVEKRADELNVGDYILQNSENLYPEKESLLDNDLMWLFGYFIGDGSINEYEDNRGGNHLKKYKLRFNDEHLSNLEKAKKIINNKFKTNINIIKNDKRSKKLFELATNMYSVNEFFLKYGFFSGEKCYEVNIPEQVKANITKNNVYSLLSGLIDSDGHINKKQGDIEYYTVSEELADDIVEILSTAGIMVSKEDKPSKRKNEVDGFRIRIPAQQAIKIKNKLTITNDADFLKGKLSLRKRRQLPVVRVKKTSKIEIEDNEFYDLTTEKNHNYLAGNRTMVFIHNTVLHGFLGEKIDSIEATKKLVKRIAENFKLPYYTLTPSFSICPVHGYLPGEHEYCPKCEAEAEAEENRRENLKAESEVE